MQDINSVVLVGNVVKEPDLRYMQNGTAIATVSIAVNRAKKNPDGTWGDEASFFDVTLFGKTAENLKQYLVKGQKIAVQGSLKQDRWQDQSGQNKSKIGIVADNVQLVGERKQQNSCSQPSFNQYQNNQQSNNKIAPNYQLTFQTDGFQEDIPF